MTRRERVRWRWVLLAALLICCLSLLGFRYQGLITPVRVASGSMAEWRVGSHYELTCRDCRFRFRCGTDTEAPLGRAVCPNCGFAENELRTEQLRRGQRVLVDRCSYWRRAVERGQVVAFHDPFNSQQLAAKRVLGLPREEISFVEGDVMLDGTIHAKSLTELWETAVLVHDDSFRPTDLPSRWQGDQASTGWKATATGYRFEPQSTAGSQDFDWLTYRHWRCYSSPFPRTDEVPIADNYGYNQGLSRELREVTDLFLVCRVLFLGRPQLAFRVHDGREEFQLEIDDSAVLRRGSEVLARVGLDARNITLGRSVQIIFGVVDRQILLAIEGSEAIRHAYEPASTSRRPIPRPLALGGSSSPFEITDVQVYRDLYYYTEDPSKRRWTLGEDELFVVGDNVPLSRDSRIWPTPGLDRGLLLGRILGARRRP